MDVIISVVAIVAGLGTYIVASFFYPFLTGGAGYTATPKSVIAEALKLADLKKDEVFYDLGCGTGEALIEALKLCEHVKGIEIEPIRWFISKLRGKKAQVILGNLYKQDISDADVIFIFQYKGTINKKIAEKIKTETRKGTRIISYIWPIENMNLFKNQKASKTQKEIFIYKI
jgi:precorrin-6B methylase 2